MHTCTQLRVCVLASHGRRGTDSFLFTCNFPVPRSLASAACGHNNWPEATTYAGAEAETVKRGTADCEMRTGSDT